MKRTATMLGIDGFAAALRTLLVLAVFAAAAGGCNSHVKVRPIPVMFNESKVGISEITPLDRQTPDFQIFYATNRVPKGPPDNRKYTNGVDKSAHLGVATLRIGSDKASWSDVSNAATGEGKNMSFVLENARELASVKGSPTTRTTEATSPFTSAIQQQLDSSPNRELNVYVHGFRTNFAWETELLGKFFHCTGRRGAMVCFAWPARQTLFLYGQDVERGLKSSPLLMDLIEMLARDTKAQRINVLAYSCGATVAADALVRLRQRYADEDPAQLSQRLRIGNVIFAASDIDLKTFARGQVKQISELAQEVNIYISDNDAALGLSALGYGTSRLGRPKQGELTRADLEALGQLQNINVVDVSKVPGPHSAGGMGGHGYWYVNDWIMNDLLVNFRWQIPPEERGLVQRPGNAKWVFPKDYPKQVTEAVRRQLIAAGATSAPSEGTGVVPPSARP